jgi:hypothetical protein
LSSPETLSLTGLWPETPSVVGGAEWRNDGGGWVLEAEGMTARVRGSGGHWSAAICLEAPGTFASASEARGAVLAALSRIYAAVAFDAASGLATDF